APADGSSAQASISADGTKVAFVSFAHNLPGAPAGAQEQVFVRDLAATTPVLASTGAGGAGNWGGGQPVLSQNGTRVAFNSYSDTLVAGDANGATDVFVRDLAAGTTT